MSWRREGKRKVGGKEREGNSMVRKKKQCLSFRSVFLFLSLSRARGLSFRLFFLPASSLEPPLSVSPVVWSECACVKKYVWKSGDWKRNPSTRTFVPAMRFARSAWSAIVVQWGSSVARQRKEGW